MTQSLETKRLILRRWQESDLAAFASLNADPQVMEHFPATSTYEESCGMVDRIGRHFDLHEFGLWAAELKPQVLKVPAENAKELLIKGGFIGFIGLQNVPFRSHFTPAVEVGWRLLKDAWGYGLAPEGAAIAMQDCFDRFKLAEIVAMTTTTNKNSMRVMEKLGMHRSAQDDFDHPRIADGHVLRRHVLYRISKDEWTKARACRTEF